MKCGEYTRGLYYKTFYGTATITVVKSFIVQAPGAYPLSRAPEKRSIHVGFM